MDWRLECITFLAVSGTCWPTSTCLTDSEHNETGLISDGIRDGSRRRTEATGTEKGSLEGWLLNQTRQHFFSSLLQNSVAYWLSLLRDQRFIQLEITYHLRGKCGSF
ncbi:hypothetical protein B0H66DRAFT_211869 [Apodospora peruviana]|uniref:Uncharacterized protein n=1 Tax=Apodospora peruviana TaxID=516989 RepID=A0AAE0M8N5_9PEZI|nr:hypothetical protein B0H66DRAFT_211869 [Apodospora peruviana]